MTDLTNRIDHVVIIVKENHTFDNYFGTFPGANGVKLEHAQNPPPGDLIISIRPGYSGPTKPDTE